MTEHDFDVSTALAALREQVHGSVTAPRASLLRRRAEHRARVRRAGAVLVAAAAVLAIVLSATAVTRWNADPVPPVGPTISPTPTPTPRPHLPIPPWPSPTIDDPITRIQWANATITIPPRTGCRSGKVRFTGGIAQAQQMALDATPDSPIAYGDLDGDGRPEAVVVFVCALIGDAPLQALAISRHSDGSLVGLGWVGPSGGLYRELWIDDGRLYADVRPDPVFENWGYSLAAALAYQWTGSHFESVESGFPGLQPPAGQPEGPVIVLGSTLAAINCPGGGTLRLPAGSWDSGVVGGLTYHFDQPEAGLNVAHLLDLAGDGHRYVVLGVACGDGPSTTDVRGQGVLVLDWDGATYRAVDVLPVALDRMLGGWRWDRGRLTVSTFWAGSGTMAPPQTWVWNGRYFQS
jgi:hypothetical protein